MYWSRWRRLAALARRPRPCARVREPRPSRAEQSWYGFEPFDSYSEVFDPYDREDHEPVVGSLSDDLLDVYRDIRGGLWSWETDATANAIWEWRFSFDTHWGDHAADALRALHRA